MIILSERFPSDAEVSEVHLVERVPPHVAARQWLIKGKRHGVVLGVGFVAPLSDPALVVRQRVMEPPGAAHVAR